MSAFDHHSLVGLPLPEAEKRIAAAGYSTTACGHHGQIQFRTEDGFVRVDVEDGEVTESSLLGDA